MTSMSTSSARFKATVRKLGINPVVDVPARVSQRLQGHAKAGRIRVQGTLNGSPILATLVPAGGGRHRLFINAGMRRATGLQVGDSACVEVRPADSSVPVPQDIAAQLHTIAGASAAFDGLSPSARREWLRYIEDAKSWSARTERIRMAASEVLGHRSGPSRRIPSRPLWSCPRCGKEFVNRNQFHSCNRHRLEDAFRGKPASIRRLFESVRRLAEAGGEVKTVPNGDWLSLMVRVRFATVRPRRNWLDLTLWLTRRCESPRFRRIETIAPGVHAHTLRIERQEDLDDEVAAWVAQACAVGRQDDRARRHPAAPTAAN